MANCKQTYLIRNPKAGIRGQREFLPIPCGKCPACINGRVNSWRWRMEQELRVSSSPYFVTLTYAEEHVPKALEYFKFKPFDERNNARIFNVLDSRHLTLYIKRLRRDFDRVLFAEYDKKGMCPVRRPQIRYYAVGEYGSLHKRPHYHLILLNCDDVRLITDNWPYGHVDVSPNRSVESVGYCAKYLNKRDSYKPCGFAPFNRMSKGLGKSYLNNEVRDFHLRKLDNCTVTMSNGVVLPLPKYMKDKIYDSFQRYKLNNYLQSRADGILSERVDKVLRSSLHLTESEVLNAIQVEPFVDSSSRLVKPTIF